MLVTNIFAKARLKEAIQHLYYYQLFSIFSADVFQMPCLRKYPDRCIHFKDDNTFYYKYLNHNKMKPIYLFINKANQYISEMDIILANLVNFDDISISKDTPHKIQQKQISDLKLKTKLLLSEFDKGEPLVEQLKSIDKDPMIPFRKNEPIASYKSVLEHFVNHLNEFKN